MKSIFPSLAAGVLLGLGVLAAAPALAQTFTYNQNLDSMWRAQTFEGQCGDEQSQWSCFNGIDGLTYDAPATALITRRLAWCSPTAS